LRRKEYQLSAGTHWEDRGKGRKKKKLGGEGRVAGVVAAATTGELGEAKTGGRRHDGKRDAMGGGIKPITLYGEPGPGQGELRRVIWAECCIHNRGHSAGLFATERRP